MQNLRCAISVGNNFLLIVLLSLFGAGCTDIFEEDISNLVVVLVAPGDSITSQSTQVSFKWNALDDNSSYRLQVARPSFSRPDFFALDTLVSDTKFQYIFTPGTYQWRVRGENGSSYTAYTTRTFVMDTISDLSKQTVILRLPASGAVFNKSRVQFKWDKIVAANNYTIKIYKDSWNGELYFTKSLITEDTVSVDLLDGTFIWSVQAINDNGGTPFSQPYRSVLIDHIPPGTPTPISPSNDTIINAPLLFKWSRAADSGTSIKDSLSVYTETGIPVNNFPISISSMQYQLDSLSPGRYLWQVKSIDAAGNQSAYSPELLFTVQ